MLKKRDPEEVVNDAEAANLGPGFRALLTAAEACSLHPTGYIYAIKYSPVQDKRIILYGAWLDTKTSPAGVLVSPGAFSGFFPLSEQHVIDCLSLGDWRLRHGGGPYPNYYSLEWERFDADRFNRGLRELLHVGD